VADLEQLRGSAQPGQWQPVLGTPGKHELRPAGEVLGKRLEDVHTVPVRKDVDVVEDEHDRLGHGRQCSAETRNAGRPHRVACRRSGPEDARIDRVDSVESCRDVGEKRDRIVVTAFERDPGEGSIVASGPLGEQRCLAVSSGRDDAHDACVRSAPEPVYEARTPHEPRTQERQRKLRLKDLEGGPVSRGRLCGPARCYLFEPHAPGGARCWVAPTAYLLLLDRGDGGRPKLPCEQMRT
jgi:hypothetical protein